MGQRPQTDVYKMTRLPGGCHGASSGGLVRGLPAGIAAFAVLLATCHMPGSLHAGQLLLAEGGKSDYVIVVSAGAGPSTRHAAVELQHFLAQMTGADLPVVTDDGPPREEEIILGDSQRLRSLGIAIDWDRLGAEGYILRTAGKKLVIAGGALRGNLYGVYGLLEDHLGCRWFAPGVSRIPKYDRLVLPPLDEVKVPVLEYREVFTFDCFDGDWSARNRVNSSAARLEEKHGGKVRFGRGFFVHTFERLVPPAKYFDTHPEYFSLVKGKRLKERSQLCCTNEDVIRICTEEILKAIAADPEAFVWSVSQNDWFNYCECTNCQSLAQQEGSQMGPVLYLVNRVAEEVEKHYPDKAIETLAYQWTRKPPRTLRPRKNVIIRLCSIECCFSHPLATCDSPANRAFREDIKGWAAIAPRLWVWDYVTNFAHYLMPFPNQRVRKPNIRFFVEHNVKGIFEQDTYDTPHSELAALGGYLTAKFLWDPDYDEEVALREFLEAYYGPAAEPIRTYLDLIHDWVEKHNIHVTIFIGVNSPHLADEILVKADQLWEEAEKRTAALPDFHTRVRLGRMSVDYAIVERARLAARVGRLEDSPLRELALRRFRPFMETLSTSGLTRLREGRPLDFPQYRSELAKVLGIAVD